VGITAAATAGLTKALVAQEVPALVDKQLPGLLTTYKGIHTAPELSHHQAQTSALLAVKVAGSERTGTALPSPHSPFFAPLPEPTLRTGVTAMTDAALALLQ
jgi:hypothetical protein